MTKQPTTELGKPIFIQTADSIIEHDAEKFGGWGAHRQSLIRRKTVKKRGEETQHQFLGVKSSETDSVHFQKN